MDFSLNWIYIAISWILLRWHQLWAMAFGSQSDIAWILAIIFLVITLRALLFPIFVKQIKSQRKFQEIQPRLAEIREKHKKDRQTAAVETQKLMRETGANPLMGCLPIFIQLPFFFGIFHVLRHINPEKSSALRAMTKEYGWSVDQFHAASDAKLFGAPIAAAFKSPDSFLNALNADRTTVQIVAATLVLIMVVSQYITARQMIARSKAAASTTDDSAARAQQTMQKVMLYGLPLSLLVSGAIFPIGVVLYQVVNNLFSMSQQFWVIKKMPHPGQEAKREISPENAKALAPKPGVKPSRTKKQTQSATSRQPNESTVDEPTSVATVTGLPSEKAAENGQSDKTSAKSGGGGSGGGTSRSKKGKKGRKGGRI